MNVSSPLRCVAFLLVAILPLLGACARQSGVPVIPIDDPSETTNRGVLEFNRGVNKAIAYPVTAVYTAVLPEVVRDGIASGIKNFDEPRIFGNDLLQGRLDAAGVTFVRFLTNSTLGVGGLIDVATSKGLPRQTGDFGQTLFVWGVDSGPYQVVPILGPSTPRDTFGAIIDKVGDPVSLALLATLPATAAPYIKYGLSAFGGIEQIQQFDDIEATSVDFYSRLKSVYEQNRAAELREAIGQKDVELTPDLITSPALEIEKPAPGGGHKQR